LIGFSKNPSSQKSFALQGILQFLKDRNLGERINSKKWWTVAVIWLLTGLSALGQITTTNLSSNAVCQGNQVEVTFTTPHSYATHSIQLSNNLGLFNSPIDLFTDFLFAGTFTFSVTIPEATEAGNSYKIRVVCNDCPDTDDPGLNISIAANPSATATITNAGCFGDNSGAIDLTV
jgi:hypothetical protein